MNRLKKVGVVAGLLFLMTGVCGCMEKDTRNSAEVMRDIALEYLNENYDDTFKAKSYSSGGLMYSYATVIFESEKYEGATVEVKIYEEEDGTYSFVDDYFRCYMYEDALEYYKGVWEEDVSVEIKIRFPNYVEANRLNGATTFVAWRQKGKCAVDAFFISNQELAEEKKNSLVKQIAKDKIAGRIAFFTTEDESLLCDKSLDEVINKKFELIDSETVFRINSDYTIEK